MINPGAYIYANTFMLTINAGTSNIIFKEVGFMSTHFNQAYHNILFEKIGTYNGGLTTVNKLEFLQNANIKGSNTFNSLIFNNTSVVELEYNTTQNIKVLFKSNPGNCIGWMTLKSSLPGSLATIQVPSGFTPTFDVSNVVMQDIRAVGSFTFNAYNSVDNSNNPGWIFPTSNTQDMFWVGGTGNWNDKMHWSYTNGGVGGACIPGPGNNVFFNSNSGFNVANNLVSITGSVYMKNITISGTTTLPVLSENEDDSEFNIYGSSEWQNGMTPIDISNIYFRNTSVNKTIKSNGVITGKFNGNTYLEESSLITLSDNFIAANQLYLQKGEFATNNQILEIGGALYLNFGDALRTLTLGSSLVNFTSPGAIFFASTDKLTLNSGTSKITFYDQAQLKPYNGQTYYDVVFEKLGTIAGTTGTVNFRNVEFHSDGNLEGNNIFNAGFTYIFEQSKHQQTTVWTPGGTPCNVTTVKSSSPSVRAQILINGGSLIFNFVNI